MNFDEIVVKESPGLCRCCLSEGCYKDLGSEYTWMNENEVYADMLLECFDISISQHTDGPNGSNRLICEVCITRLRDACNFKKQVLDSEKKFVDLLARGEFQPKMVMYQAEPMKTEQLLEESAADDADVEYLEDMDLEDDVPLNQIGQSLEASVSEVGSSIKVKGKRGRPRKTTTSAKPEKKPKIPKLEEKPRSSKAVAKGKPGGSQKMSADIGGSGNTNHRGVKANDSATESDNKSGSDSEFTHPVKQSNVEVSGKAAKDKRKIMRNNVIQVLLKSTVMPFRWLKSSYRCFYCYDIFQEASDLKEHQNVHTGDEIKVQTMNNFWENVVYVDISNLSCKLCPENVTDLYDLIDHLVAKHHVVYNKDVGICIVAFKLDNFNISCLVCGATFYTFGPLLHHTNKDHKGTSAILCEVCGQHFKSATLLRLHVKAVHENTELLCTECGEKFESRGKLKTHQKNQHDIEKKHKCLVCPLYFTSHYKRSRHMAEEHKNRPEVKCLHCPKTFVFRSMMMTHLRDAHLKVRNHVCGVCGFRAFTSNRLKNHMYKHSAEKNFKCDVCDKAFTTRKIMKAHFARMHKNQNQQQIGYEHAFGRQ